MNNKLIYSTTTRTLGKQGNVIDFKNGLKLIENSSFKNANFNFGEIHEILDKENYNEIFKTVIKDCKLTFSTTHAPIHFPFFFDDYYTSENRELYEERILKAIELSSKINARWIVIHIGTVLDCNGKYDFKKSIAENINYLKKFIECAIKNNIKIAIENGTNMYKEVTPCIDELLEIVKYYNNLYEREILGICFDFGHANVANINIYEDIKKIGNNLKVTHIHDNYGSDTHNFPKDGTINWTLVKRALDEIEYSGELTLEVRYKNNLFNTEIINKTYELLDEIFYK